MFRLTRKNLAANRVRFALTTLGVTLAVSFVVSAFVLGDGLRSSFTTVSEDITAGVDIEVRNVVEFGDPEPLPIEFVASVSAIDGVADAVASIEAADNAVRPIKANGDTISVSGPPQLAFNWVDNDELSAFSLVAGTAPAMGQFVIDLDSAAKHDFAIGETYELITPSGRTHLTLSGTSSFGEDNSTLGAVLMQMNTAEAGEIFSIDGVSTVNVELEDGADPAAVLAAIAAAVPSADVVDHATVLAETTSEFTDEIDIVGNILLAFGGVALFVSIFIIYNTFAIVLSQRTRELALLRAIGANPKQIRRSVLGEAFVIGVIASAAGIGGGIGVAKGLEAMFALIGADLPEYPMILATRTLVAAAVIGIGITMLAAIGPARKASSVPPVAAMRGDVGSSAPGSRTRKVSGFALFGGGIIAGTMGLAGVGSLGAALALMAFGALGIFLGVTVLSPLAVKPVTAILGWPMAKIAGVAGRMAQKNAARNSRRTASTAAALMIGLALVTTALVVGESIKANIGTTLEETARADYFITDQLSQVDFPSNLDDEIRSADIVDAATGFRYVDARVGETIQNVGAADFDQVDAVLDLGIGDGGYDTTVVNPVLISVDEAETLAIGVGDTVTVEFSDGSIVDATITGTFDEQVLITQDYLFDTTVFDTAGVTKTDEWVGISVVDGADPAAVTALVAELSERFPHADIETKAEFQKRIEGFVDGTLAMVNVMVALAVIIALIGIANTLALSVFERTRELGLIRAVGMSRRQLRRMVRFEAALVATFGAVLGVSVGLLFGWGIVIALPETFASAVSVPAMGIVVVILIAATAGVVAAWLPARRAGKLNVLDAISH